MNNKTKIVIIGGVAAGASAAARARRIDEHAKITIIEKSPYISFANCGMPYYLGGEIADRKKLILNTPEFFKKRFNIDALVNHKAVSINRSEKTVTVSDLATDSVFEIMYDKLLIATGACPIVPQIEGVDAKNLFTLRNIPDMDAIKSYIDHNSPKEAVVLGAGFIGLELAEQLKVAGLNVTVVEKAPQILAPLDPEMAAIVEEHLISNGVKLIKNDGVQSIIKDGAVGQKVKLESGAELNSGIILLSIGIRPDTALALSAKLKIGATGAISVNERMQTSDENIFAAGDAVESVHKVTGKKVWIPLAGPANFQGRTAGTVMAGGEARFSGVIGTVITRVNKITAAKTGISEKEAMKEGLDFFASYSHSPSHASYYPGAAMEHIKLIVENSSGRLLGAQVVGYDGVDKTIDIIASAVSFGKTAYDLVDLDLAYAPPFSQAKPPAQMAGMVAVNRLDGIEEFIEADEAVRLGYKIIDVRTPLEHTKDAIFEESLSIPVDTLRDNIPDYSKTDNIALLCKAGIRSYIAYRILKQKGFENVRNINGGFMISRHILKTRDRD